MPVIFDESFLQEVRDRNDLVEVAGAYVDLKRSGNRYVGLCPFHHEKTPSFHVTKENQLYYCFGCHEGGNVITFIEKMEHLDFVETVKFLAERANIPLPEENEAVPQEIALKRKIYDMNKEAARFFYANLNSKDGQAALSYLRDRGLADKTIITYGLGYAKKGNDTLIRYLKAKGYREEEMQSAGLIAKGKYGYYDFFRDRVIFPVIDLRGNIIAFGGRVMGDAMPKYLNTGETLVFKKHLNLFSLNIAKSKNKNYLILAEGYMDVISLYQYGFTNAVASLGTAFCEDHAKLLKKYTDTVLLCYDSDNAGQEALKKAGDILLREGLKVKVPILSGGKDPDEILKKYGEEYFQNILSGAKPYIEHMLEKEKQEVNTYSIEGKVAYAKRAVAQLMKVNDPLEKELYIKKLASELNLGEDVIRSDLKKKTSAKVTGIRKKEEQKQYQKLKNMTEEERMKRNLENAQGEILYILLNRPDLAKRTRIEESVFVNPVYQKLYRILKDVQNPVADANSAISMLDPQEQGTAARLMLKEVKYDDDLLALRQLTANMEGILDKMKMLESKDLADLDGLLKKYRNNIVDE
jgi:DNA primase